MKRTYETQEVPPAQKPESDETPVMRQMFEARQSPDDWLGHENDDLT